MGGLSTEGNCLLTLRWFRSRAFASASSKAEYLPPKPHSKDFSEAVRGAAIA